MFEEDTSDSFKNIFSSLTSKKAILTICIIGLLVYFNALFNGFVWDDFSYIVNNPTIATFNLKILLGQNSFYLPGFFYRPLSAL